MAYTMNAIARGLVTAVVFGLTTGVTYGGPVLTYTVSGTASGQLGTTAFTNALVTFAATADTSNIVNVPINGGTFVVTATSATVNVAGIGTATITSPIEAYDLPGNAQAGLEITATPLTSFQALTGMVLPAFASYNLATPIGPLSGNGFIGNVPGSLQTTSGQLTIPILNTFLTFTAAATVPEPSSLVLTATAGLIGLACAWGRRRMTRARA
jgi:hypothetical protein